LGGYGITDASISNQTVTLGSNSVTVPTKTSDLTNDSNFIAKDNTSSYTPTGDYNPASKKYVDDYFFQGYEEDWEEMTEQQQNKFAIAIVADTYELTTQDRQNLASILGDNT
jgi:hypothetical protein